MNQNKTSQDLTNNVRRDLIKRFFGVTAAMTLPSTGLFPTTLLASQQANFTVADVTPTKISDHIYVLYARGAWPSPENQGFFANIYLVKTQKGIVVLDTGTSVHIGEMAIRAIKKAFNQPVIAVFNSHFHGDHWLGNDAFNKEYKNLPIYAHPDAIDAIKNAVGDEWLNQMSKATKGAVDGTKVTPPNQGVTHGQTFDYGDVTLKVHSYGPAHSPVDIMVEILEDQALFVGDVIMQNRIGNPSETSFEGYLKTLSIIHNDLSSLLLMPGHGKPGKEELLSTYEDIMHGIYDNTKKAVADGLSIEEAKKLVLNDPRITKHEKTTEGFEDIGKFVSYAYTEAETKAF